MDAWDSGPAGPRDADRGRVERAFEPLARPPGAVQLRSRASRRPASVALPPVGPSSARPSGKPASTRSASRQVQIVAPRGDFTSVPSRRSSTSWVADSGVMSSKNSQFTIITGA